MKKFYEKNMIEWLIFLSIVSVMALFISYFAPEVGFLSTFFVLIACLWLHSCMDNYENEMPNYINSRYKKIPEELRGKNAVKYWLITVSVFALLFAIAFMFYKFGY